MGTRKFIIVFLSVVLSFAFVLGAFTALASGFGNWLSLDNGIENGIVAVDGDGNKMSSDGYYSLPMSMSFLSTEPMTSTPTAPTSVNVTVDIRPSQVTWAKIDWTVAFVSSSGWASGRNVSSYVTVIPTNEQGTAATVNCLQAFGIQVELVATVRNSTVSASCKIDYIGRIADLALSGTKRDGTDVLIDGDEWVWDESIINVATNLTDKLLTSYEPVITTAGIMSKEPACNFYMRYYGDTPMLEAINEEFDLNGDAHIGYSPPIIGIGNGYLSAGIDLLLEYAYNIRAITDYDISIAKDILKFMINQPDTIWFYLELRVVTPVEVFNKRIAITSADSLRDAVESISLDIDEIIF